MGLNPAPTLRRERLDPGHVCQATEVKCVSAVRWSLYGLQVIGQTRAVSYGSLALCFGGALCFTRFMMLWPNGTRTAR